MLRYLLFAAWTALFPVALASADAGAYAEPGAYGVGVRTLHLVDRSRPTMAYGPYDGSDSRELDVEVWYPADTGQGLVEVRGAAPASSLKFPLILRAHGLGGRARDAVYLTTFLATHGYVVAAPSFPLSKFDTPALIPTYFDVAEQPRDLSFVADQLTLSAAEPQGFLAGRIDTGKIGSLGHSLGGLTVLLHGYSRELRDPRVRAVAALAPWACSLQQEFFDGSDVPALWMGGTADLITPYNRNQALPFERASSPRVLVTLEDGIHINFSRALFDIDAGENPDDVYCDGTFGLLGLRPLPTPKLPSTIGDSPEIEPGSCGSICPQWSGDFMDEQRQHELTRTAVVEFFDAELRGSAAAYDALVTGLDGEPDVTTAVSGGGCPFGSCLVSAVCTSCGQPLSIDAELPGAADARSVLLSAVGLGSQCPACVCDVDANDAVDATDSLIVLRRAVGLGVELFCRRPAP